MTHTDKSLIMQGIYFFFKSYTLRKFFAFDVILYVFCMLCYACNNRSNCVYVPIYWYICIIDYSIYNSHARIYLNLVACVHKTQSASERFFLSIDSPVNKKLELIIM